jgi:uncharacterized protein YxeA
MKKTIVLLTIVLAIVAAPVFAEVTASGDVDFRFAYSADNYKEKNDNDLKVTYGATLSDFTSLSVSAEATNETGKTGIDLTADDYLGNYLKLNQMTLTQDVTGALGVDAGVGVAVTFGISSFEPKEYQAVAGYGDLEYDDDSDDLNTYNILPSDSIMTKASISVSDMVTVDAAIYEPGSEVGSDMMMYGVNAYGTFGMVDASVSFLKRADKVTILGINGAAAPIEGLKVGAGFTQLSDDGDTYGAYGVSVAYTMDALTAGVAMTSKTDSVDEPDFVDVTTLAFNVNYQVTEAAKVFAGAKLTTLSSDVDMEDKLNYEVGGAYVLDGVTYTAGYTLFSDYKAYTGKFMDGADRVGNVFFRVQASF